MESWWKNDEKKRNQAMKVPLQHLYKINQRGQGSGI